MTNVLPEDSTVKAGVSLRTNRLLLLHKDTPANPFSQMDIPVLTRAIYQGDHKAFEQFYEAVFSPLYHYLLVCSGGHQQTVQDAQQETLIKTARNMKIFQNETDLWNWVRCIARNALIDQIRRSRTHRHLLLQPEDKCLDNKYKQDYQSELYSHLDHCMNQLSLTERSLIQGKYLHIKTCKTLAQEHNLTVKAVESRLSRIRRKLKNLMLKRLRP